MPPTTAPTAPDQTQTVSEPTTDAYGFPIEDDRDGHQMSDKEMDTYVNKQLGLKPGEASEPAAPAEVTIAPPAAPPATQPQPPDQPGTPTLPEPAVPAPTEAGSDASVTQPTTPTTNPAVPESSVQLPSEADTSDLWIEVKNPEGETVRLTLDEGIPDDMLFVNDKQLFEVMDSFNEMRQVRSDRETKIQKTLDERQATEADTQTRQETINSWTQEIQELVNAGMIPKTDIQPANGQTYTPQEIAANPGLQVTSDIFGYMTAENEKRQKAGQDPIKSFGVAFNLFQNDKTRGETEAKAKADAELAKRRGAIVGGGGTPTGGGKPYVYRRGSARNIHQVDTSDI
jgi:hypothetical protein